MPDSKDLTNWMIADALGYDYSPQNIKTLAEKASKAYGIPSAVLMGLAKHESNFNPSVVGGNGELGITQFMPETMKMKDSQGKRYVDDPLDPAEAIDGAARYLRDLKAKNGGNLYNAIRNYNGSLDNPQTDQYAKNVLAQAKQFDPNFTAPSPDGQVDWDRLLGDETPAATSAQAKAQTPALAVQPLPATPVSAPAAAPAPQAVPTQPAAETPADGAAPQWSGLENALNVGTLGLYGKVRSASEALAGSGMLAGPEGMPVPGVDQTPAPDRYNALYSAAEAGQNNAIADWKLNHPYMNIGSMVAGLAVPTMLGTGAVNAAGRALVGATEGVPLVGSAANAIGKTFLTPTTGELKNMGTLGKLAMRLGTGAVGGAVSGAASQPTEDDGTFGKNMLISTAAGAGLGALLGPVGEAMRPYISANTAALAQNFEKTFGTQIPLGLITGNPANGVADSETMKGFTRAVGQTIGVNADAITPDVLDAAKRAAGQEIGSMRTAIRPDISLSTNPGFFRGLTSLVRDAESSGDAASGRKAREIYDVIRQDYLTNPNPQDGLTPKVWETLDGHKGLMYDFARVDPYRAKQFAQLFDTAVEKGGTPDLVSAYKDARTKYWSASQLDDAVNNSPSGILHPADVVRAWDDAQSPQANLVRRAGELFPGKVDVNGNPTQAAGPGMMKQIAHAIGDHLGLTAVTGAGYLSGGESANAIGGAGLAAAGGQAAGKAFVNHLLLPAAKDSLLQNAMAGGKPMFTQDMLNALSNAAGTTAFTRLQGGQ